MLKSIGYRPVGAAGGGKIGMGAGMVNPRCHALADDLIRGPLVARAELRVTLGSSPREAIVDGRDYAPRKVGIAASRYTVSSDAP